MAENFYSILTDIGHAKIANSQVSGEKVNIVEMAVGDGGGSYYNPTSDQESLVNEVWRGNIGSIDIDEENPNWIVIETVIPTDTDAFMLREVGVFDDEGDMIAVGKYPETFKPSLDDGSAKDLYVRMIIEVTNAEAVTLKIDPAVTIASRKYVDEKVEDLSEKVGNLDNLDTQEKNNLVSSINELKDEIGSLDELNTETKSNLVSSLNEIHDEVMSHLAETMPHQIKDLDNNKTYRYGLQAKNGVTQFIYEEVIE